MENNIYIKLVLYLVDSCVYPHIVPGRIGLFVTGIGARVVVVVGRGRVNIGIGLDVVEVGRVEAVALLGGNRAKKYYNNNIEKNCYYLYSCCIY